MPNRKRALSKTTDTRKRQRTAEALNRDASTELLFALHRWMEQYETLDDVIDALPKPLVAQLAPKIESLKRQVLQSLLTEHLASIGMPNSIRDVLGNQVFTDIARMVEVGQNGQEKPVEKEAEHKE